MRRYSLLFAIILAAPAPADEPKKAGPDWWSLQPVVRPALPDIKNGGWPRNPIDVFILAKLEAAGLTPAPEAEPITLLRRLYFDVIGLPPPPDEIDAFLREYAVSSQTAVEKVVDCLLASPLYGERWGRHWLDVARFAESQGFERDKIRDHAWRYRDYVIDSFNRDKPYDQFVREQLAGDVLSNATPESIIATGFLVAGPFDEAGTSSASPIVRGRVREEEMEDMLAAVGQTFMGLTVNCARCHDHKFDPIPQRDYYRIKAVFDGVRHGDRSLITKEELRLRSEKIAALERLILEKEKNIQELEKLARESLPAAKKEQMNMAVPMPVARWTFQTDARDSIGSMHGTLRGNAKIGNGRLIVDGKDSYMETKPLNVDLHEKTLEAWVALADKTQRGGGVMTVQTQNGDTFDAIVFGERQAGKWMAGSEFFRRTRDHDGDNENANAEDLIHLVIVYSHDSTITMYHNSKQYFQYRPRGDNSDLQSFNAESAQVLLGLRHTGAGNGFFSGEIEEARLYAKALTPDQVRMSYERGFSTVTQADIEAALIPFFREQHKQRMAELKQLRAERGRLQTDNSFAYAANVSKSGVTQVLLRGDIEKPGETVRPGGLSTLPKSDFGLPVLCPDAERRMKFAEWVASPENPLTARVMVNRLWHYHFGRGLVGTPNDFGLNGERPTHPELLDWLANEFSSATPQAAWSVKRIHRLILTSATYRQASSVPHSEFRTPNSDEENRLLWHFAPKRLEAEAVRDAMLAVSGQLRHVGGGPGFRPFKVTVFNSSFYDLIDEDRPEFNRRTVYRTNVNSAKDRLLEAFDCPEPSVKAPKRIATTTPLQALELMNSAFVQRQAKHFAQRVEGEAGDDVDAQIERAYKIALARSPSVNERTRLAHLAREHGLVQGCWVLLNSSEFLYAK